jgi:DNA excision repair protein ERCC-4
MVICLPDFAEDLLKEKRDDLELSVDTRTRQLTVGSSATAIASNKLSSGINSSGLSRKDLEVVVDVREFRSSLPSLLHSNGFKIIPRTLLVADFVLTPDICIERKGISDLFSSFASGRLYSQAESMSRYYKYPCLLIEFSKERNSMVLQSPGEISTDSIQTSSISSKLAMLALAFPNLRYLWSKYVFISLYDFSESRCIGPRMRRATYLGS